jgi:hypothetical protein
MRLYPRFTATYRTVSVYRVLQMRGGGYADVLPVLQVPDNKADAVPCKRLQKKGCGVFSTPQPFEFVLSYTFSIYYSPKIPLRAGSIGLA